VRVYVTVTNRLAVIGNDGDLLTRFKSSERRATNIYLIAIDPEVTVAQAALFILLQVEGGEFHSWVSG
jgi:hypothetical protein